MSSQDEFFKAPIKPELTMLQGGNGVPAETGGFMTRCIDSITHIPKHDYQQEAIDNLERLLRQGPQDRKPCVIYFGNPERATGKSQYIHQMLAERGVEVVHVDFETYAEAQRRIQPNWEVIAIDECGPLNIEEWRKLIVPKCTESWEAVGPGKRAHTGRIGRSRRAKQERWR